MELTCKICSGGFKESPDALVLCNHHSSPIHLGCCMRNCSMDGKPCKNAIASYDKL